MLGVSITANRKSIHLANAVGGTVQSVECNDISTDDPDDFLNTLIERIKALVFDADFNRSRLLGIGVSAAISADDGMRTESDLVNSEQLGWFGVPVRKKLEDAIKLPVKVEHRASAILRGELGNADIDEDLVLVNVAHGIGTSAYLNGHFMTAGDRGFGALSHFSDGTSDIQCDCGRLGCLEVTASGKAVLRSLYGPNQPMTGVAVRLRNAILMADEGKPDAQSAFYQAGTNLGAGVDAVLTLLKPTTILIAGEIGRQNDFHRGLVEALIQRGRNNVEGIIRRSSITSEQAAVSVALQNFLFTGDLKFDALLGV